MTEKEKIIATAYTGFMFVHGKDLGKVYAYEEEKLGHGVLDIMHASKEFDQKVREAVKDDFIAMLKEEPVSEDLEEAATNYAKSIAQFDLQRTYSIYDFKAGANWQKIQMMRMLMKGAVNGVAWEDFNDDENKYLVINATGTKLRKGDKFKMIIIKEEEK